MSAPSSMIIDVDINQSKNHHVPVYVQVAQPPRLVITPSTPCFPDNLSRSHRSIPSEDNRPRPIMPRPRALEYKDVQLSEIEKPKRRSSYGYPSPHLLAPPLPTTNNTTRSTRSPIISILFLLLSVVLVGSSMFVNTDSSNLLSSMNIQDPFGGEGGWLEGIMNIRIDHQLTKSDNNINNNGGSGSGSGGSKVFLTTEEWKAYLGKTDDKSEATNERGRGKGKGAESWVGTMGLGDLYDFH